MFSSSAETFGQAPHNIRHTVTWQMQHDPECRRTVAQLSLADQLCRHRARAISLQPLFSIWHQKIVQWLTVAHVCVSVCVQWSSLSLSILIIYSPSPTLSSTSRETEEERSASASLSSFSLPPTPSPTMHCCSRLSDSSQPAHAEDIIVFVYPCCFIATYYSSVYCCIPSTSNSTLASFFILFGGVVLIPLHHHPHHPSLLMWSSVHPGVCLPLRILSVLSLHFILGHKQQFTHCHHSFLLVSSLYWCHYHQDH